MDISIAGVSERDVDLMLLEEFMSSPAFGAWFIQQTVGPSLNVGECEDAQHSVTDATGESDLEITFVNGGGERTRFLVENKVRAGLQPRQAERYRLRGSGYVSRGLCTRYYSVIVAPSLYFGGAGTKGFDYKLTYETILDWFFAATDLGKRRQYKSALLKAAIEKGSLGYQPAEDAASSCFWKDYWLYSCKHAPELEMRKPGPKPAGSTFVAFYPPELPRGVDLVHKLTHGFVDLQFVGVAGRLNVFCAEISHLLEDGMTVDRAGKSAAVRLRSPRLDLGASASSQASNVLTGLQAAQNLRKMVLH